ncbi:MAG: LacI family transcriptional regulator [Phycisphaerae bacterium]|nr:LacI family transcriptional regulator [Phycisphaerae bacterium]
MKNKVTISDVAREANVSSQTVSRVINRKGEISDETRRLVLEVIQRLGYRPSSIARGLATNRTFTIGLVVPDIANPFFPEIARGIEDFAWERGYGVILCNTVEDPAREEAAIKSLEDKRVDGIIICSARLAQPTLCDLLQPHRAAVLINRTVPSQLAGVVRVDDAYGAGLAVNHLLAHHRREIGFIAGPASSQSGVLRAEGAQKAMAEAGLAIDSLRKTECKPTHAGGLAAARELIAGHPEINALLCYNDLVAIGALQACREMNLSVPQDVAIVGCDDTLLAGLVQPALTTVSVPKYEIGAAAAGMLFSRIAGEAGRDEIVYKPELIVRQSTPGCQ